MKKNITITRVGASSIGRLLGTVNAIVALAAGIISSLVAVAGVVSNQNLSIWQDIGVSMLIVVAGVIVLPILSFIFGWLYGALIGVIWNAILGTSGGLDVSIEETSIDKK